MQPVNGFFGHIQKNHARSLIMFMGFMLSMHITVATIMSIPFPFWRHIPAVFDDPIGYVQTMGLMVTALNFIIFVLFYFGQTFLLKWTIGFEPLTLNNNPRLHNITQNLATMAGIPMPQLDYIPTPALNSFASGLSKHNAHIIVTQGLLDALDDDELAAVIAHEIAHIKNGDMHMMAVANAAIGSIKSVNFINPMKFTFFKRIPPIGFILGFPILFPVFILVIFYSFIMQLTSLIASATKYVISSSREYIADAEAVRLTHNPAALVSALSKIHGRSNLHCNNTIANAMMIDGPTTGKDASHPPIQIRMEKLAQLSGSMIHGTGMRRDTRQRSLASHNGNAYAPVPYGQGASSAPSFAQGFGRVAPITRSNIRDYIPASADYAAYQGKTFKTEEPESLFDRISLGDDGEFGLDQPVRWAIIAVLSVYLANKFYHKAKTPPTAVPQHIETVFDYTPAFVTFDLKSDGLVTISQPTSKVFMDVHNHGKKYNIGWVGPGEGILFHDANQNKHMDGFSELVTFEYGRAKIAKSFEMLRKFDSNHDGVITRKDTDFPNLMLWRDRGIDGKYEPNEGSSLSELGITSLVLRATQFETSEGRTLDTKTKLIRKGRYVHDVDRVSKPIRDMAGGRIYMTSFETDMTQYKTADGKLVKQPLPDMNTGQTVNPSIQIAQTQSSSSQPPKLRLIRSRP